MQRKTRRLLGTAGMLLGTSSLMLGLLATPSSATHVTPTEHTGNASCAELNPGASGEIKLEGSDLKNGPYTEGSRTVTISNLTANSFDFTANFAVSSVFVKAGNGGNLYTYNPPVFGDTNLVTPGVQAISHISFCYVNTTTTTTTAPTTTTTAPTTTTTQGTTTTTVAPTTTTTVAPTTTTTVAPTTTTTVAPTTTTTVAPTTTTTVAPTTTTTQGTTTTAPFVIVTSTTAPTTTTTAPTTTTEAVEVLPSTTERIEASTETTAAATEVRGNVLARTGNETRPLLLVAGFFLLIGGSLVYSSSRMRSA